MAIESSKATSADPGLQVGFVERSAVVNKLEPVLIDCDAHLAGALQSLAGVLGVLDEFENKA